MSVRAGLLVVALLAAVAVPASAPAREDAAICDSAIAPAGRCDTRRPSPSLRVNPVAPRAGSPIVLSVSSPGRGLTYAWDLDGDGAFDDGAGEAVTTALATGTRTVGVRATDEDGRRGSELRTLEVHAANLRPRARLEVLTPAPSPRNTEVALDAQDPDGHIARVELDLDGNGEYELGEDFAPGETVHVEKARIDPGLGPQTLHARVFDDAGAATELATSLDIHIGNVAPRVSVVVEPSAPRPGEPVTVSAVASDPDGKAPMVIYDLDGDGTYEIWPEHPSVVTSFAAEGVYEVGAQAIDDDGKVASSRRSVEVAASPGAPFEIVLPEWPVRPGVAAPFHAGGAQEWDFDGDGEFDDGAGPGPSYAFPEPGTFPVRARTAGGRVAMRTVAVTVDAGLAPAVTELELPAVIRSGRPTTFAAVAVDPDGDPLTLTFDLDGDGAFDETPEGGDGTYRWTFPASGPITVGVRAEDPAGHVASRSAVVEPTELDLPPDLVLDVGAAVAGSALALHAQTPGSITWDTNGDGAFDDSSSFTPPAPGEYTLRARASGSDGASTTVARTIVAGTRPPIAAFDASQTGGTVTLTSASSDPDGGPLALTAWDLDDDGAFDDGTGAVVEIALAAGTHSIGLKVRDGGGDSGVRYATVVVAPPEEPTATATPTASPVPTATAVPTATPTAVPTATAVPTVTATPAPTVAPGPPGPAPRGDAPVRDRTPPAVKAVVRSASRTSLLARGLLVDARCSEACNLTIKASVDAATARRLGLGSSRILGQATRRLRPSAGETIAVRLSARAKRGVRKVSAVKASVVVTASDSSGNRTIASRRFSTSKR